MIKEYIKAKQYQKNNKKEEYKKILLGLKDDIEEYMGTNTNGVKCTWFYIHNHIGENKLARRLGFRHDGKRYYINLFSLLLFQIILKIHKINKVEI